MTCGKPLGSIQLFCNALCASDISFCHWKSNNALHKSMAGENDLDLLIARQDISTFRAIAFSHGLKLVRGTGFRNIPGLEDYFGRDAISGRIFHVQAHYLLVIGHDMTKNFWLPIEAAYLASASQKTGDPLPTPSPEMELAVFCIRMMLKFSLLGTLRGRSELTGSMLEEFQDLCSRADHFLMAEIITRHFPMLSKDLLDKCQECLQPGSSIFTRYWIHKQIRYALSGFQRVGLLHENLRRHKVRLQLLLGKFFPAYRPNRKLAAGGLLIAIVGGDGAGKSTAIANITEWLRHDFDIVVCHMGKPPRAFLSRIMDGFLKLSGLRHRYAAMSDMQSFPGYLWMLRSILYARDRYRCFSRAIRMASRGCIVIFDRYYFPTFSTMDGPTCHIATRFRENTISARLADWERSYLDRISMPQLMIHLDVSVDTAVARKIDEASNYVRRRNEEIRQSNWLKQQAMTVNANLKPQDVISQIQRLIWERI